MPTPVKVEVLSKYLEGYENAQYIIDGFTQGFRINFDGPDLPLTSSNSDSANQNPQAVDQKIKKELELGRLAGPFDSVPFQNYKCSPLALREKQNTGKYRLLHNLSFPYDATSVNYNISKDDSTVSYSNIKDAISLIQAASPPAFMAKTDISDAFRIIPIHPSDYHLTGFYWKGYYYDKCLPMGCSSSCKIFELFSSALQWILKEKFGIVDVVKILDDFLFIEEEFHQCKNSLQTFITLCNELGVPLAPHKTEGPSTSIVFLGIGLDSQKMLAFLPPDKLERYSNEVKLCLSRNKMTLKELQSLCGKLQFSTSVIRSGKAFLRRMYDIQIGINKPHHFIRITSEVKQDLEIWYHFLENYNGQSIIRKPPFGDSNTLHMWSDASKLGFGATYGTQWMQSKWPDSWAKLNIALLEIFPILVLVASFGPKIQNSKILFHCDNSAVVAIVNKQTSTDKLIMKVVRPLVLLLLEYNINLKTEHIPGVNNVLADSISRFQVHPALLHQYGMQHSPTPIPPHVRPENFSLF